MQGESDKMNFRTLNNILLEDSLMLRNPLLHQGSKLYKPFMKATLILLTFILITSCTMNHHLTKGALVDNISINLTFAPTISDYERDLLTRKLGNFIDDFNYDKHTFKVTREPMDSFHTLHLQVDRLLSPSVGIKIAGIGMDLALGVGLPLIYNKNVLFYFPFFRTVNNTFISYRLPYGLKQKDNTFIQTKLLTKSTGFKNRQYEYSYNLRSFDLTLYDFILTIEKQYRNINGI